jgi:drug/metabolite transporter (DMT)-like permease
MVLVGGSVAVSEILGDAPLFTAQAIRYGAAAALLLLLSRVAGVEIVRPRGHEWLWLGGIAATGLVLFNVAVVRGVAHAEPAAIAVAVACVPLVIGLIGPLLDGQRPARRVVMAAVVVTMGGVIVEGTGRTDATGIAWAVITLLCEAAFTLLAIPMLRRQGAWGVSVHTVWIATIMLVALGLLTEGPDAAMRLRADHWAAIGYLAGLVTAVAFVCWYSSVAIVGAGQAGLLTGVAPPAAAIAGALSIGQLPALPVWLGMGVVCVGLGIGLASRRRVGPVQVTQAAGVRGFRAERA